MFNCPNRPAVPATQLLDPDPLIRSLRYFRFLCTLQTGSGVGSTHTQTLASPFSGFMGSLPYSQRTQQICQTEAGDGAEIVGRGTGRTRVPLKVGHIYPKRSRSLRNGHEDQEPCRERGAGTAGCAMEALEARGGTASPRSQEKAPQFDPSLVATPQEVGSNALKAAC